MRWVGAYLASGVRWACGVCLQHRVGVACCDTIIVCVRDSGNAADLLCQADIVVRCSNPLPDLCD